jgi:response regulator RpfG family c-di-GMP phosphodiesterase
VLTRCERGADIARMLGFSEATSQAIRALDEHWDGQGQPYRMKGEDTPLLGLAQEDYHQAA